VTNDRILKQAMPMCHHAKQKPGRPRKSYRKTSNKHPSIYLNTDLETLGPNYKNILWFIVQ